jgi:hypothetical protein
MDEPIDQNILAKFLSEANKDTYANPSSPKATSLRPNSEDYHFEKDGLIYHDTYFGSRDFIGSEVVYKDGKPVWAMNYYGFIIKSEASTKDTYSILRSALRQEYSDVIPVRGPREYEEGENKYRNKAEGDLGSFSGEEEILLRGEKVYHCHYHGGFIR